MHQQEFSADRVRLWFVPQLSHLRRATKPGFLFVDRIVSRHAPLSQMVFRSHTKAYRPVVIGLDKIFFAIFSEISGQLNPQLGRVVIRRRRIPVEPCTFEQHTVMFGKLA